MININEDVSGCIYRLTSPSGKVYIGKTTQKFSARIKQHQSESRSKKKHKFACAVRKYGLDNFVKEILISDIYDNELLSLIEIETIAYEAAKGTVLYNMTIGGEGVVGFLNDDMKKRIFTEEYRQKMSSIVKERYKNPEYADKIKNIAKNRPQHLKDKLSKQSSEFGKNRWKDPEYRARMSDMALKLWQDQHYSELQQKKKIERANTPQNKALISLRFKEKWKNEEFRSKVLATRSITVASKEYKERRRVQQTVVSRSMSKLDETDILEIRRLLDCGISQSAISKKYNIGQSTVSRIKLRKSWADI